MRKGYRARVQEPMPLQKFYHGFAELTVWQSCNFQTVRDACLTVPRRDENEPLAGMCDRGCQTSRRLINPFKVLVERDARVRLPRIQCSAVLRVEK